MKIKQVYARQILDSRGNPTIEAEVYLENGYMGRAAVPSGASTGTHEAVELRDDDPKVYNGKGVLKAINNVNTVINDALKGFDVFDQKGIDWKMIELDGLPNKARLGANSILSVSLAAAHAASISQNKPLYAYLTTLAQRFDEKYLLPLPMMVFFEGGKHGDWATDIQEFMICPIAGEKFSQSLQIAAEVFHSLEKVLKDYHYSPTVGFEGGYAPKLKKGNIEALDLLLQAISKAGYIPGKDVVLALDAAASEFYSNGKYYLKSEEKELTSDEMIKYWSELINKYPIASLEDPLDQEDWESWTKLTATLGNKIQIVGDDLLVTNLDFIKRGVKEKTANAALIKLNQIGTLTETMNAVLFAQSEHWNTIISHRAGETEDTTIAHLATALSTGQIKTGSVTRTDRVGKYNELLRIEEMLGDKGQFNGKGTFPRK